MISISQTYQYDAISIAKGGILIAIWSVRQSLRKYPNTDRNIIPVAHEKTIAISMAGLLRGDVTSLTVRSCSSSVIRMELFVSDNWDSRIVIIVHR